MPKLNTGYRPSSIKEHNQNLVYRTIYQKEPISRTAITEITNLAPTTVTNVVKELINEELIMEAGYSDNTQGRRRVYLKIVPNSYFIIGVDLNRAGFTVVLSDLKANILERYDSDIKKPNIVISEIITIIDNLIHKEHISKDKILGIGFGAPGPLDSNQGIILNPPNFPCWENILIKDILESKLNIPVYLENDARACAMGEKLFGVAKDKDNFIYLACGTGIGSAYYANGSFHKGFNGIAGEIGHTTVDINGPKCSCGNLGCLELYTSVFSIKDKFKKKIKDREDDKLNVIKNGQVLDEILVYLNKGNKWAEEIVNEIGKYIGIAATNLINIMGTENIILGREIPSKWGEVILNPIKEVVKNNNLFRLTRTPEVILAQLKDEASTVGAASIIIQAFLKGEIKKNNFKS